MPTKVSNGLDLQNQKITNLDDPDSAQDAATRAWVEAAIAAVVDAAPGTLDTLNELAAALGDDPNFAATLATTISAKVAKADYNAQTVLVAVTDDTPTALTLGASTVLGRRASGDIVAISYANLMSDLLSSLRYATAIGDGSDVSITVTHNLNSRDVQVTVYRAASPYDEIICDVEHTDANNVELKFATAPTSGQFRVVVSLA